MKPATSSGQTRGGGRPQRSVLVIDLAKRLGGAEVRVLAVARSLRDRGVRSVVATLRGSQLEDCLRAAALPTVSVPHGRGDPRTARFLARTIREDDYQVVDAHNAHSQLWAQLGAKLSRKHPLCVSTVHSSYRLEYGRSLRGYAYEQVLKLNSRSGNVFIAVSESVFDYLRQLGVPRDRIVLSHNSSSPLHIRSSRRDIDVFAARGWNANAFVVIVVARLERVKGHRFLLDALRLLADEHEHLRCLIVGDGRTRHDLEARVRHLGLESRVCFAGFRTDVPALLSAADLFCLPSLSEGLPWALLEAASLGVPLLVTDVGGVSRLMSHLANAFVVPPSNAAALANGIRWLIEHPLEAKRLGAAGYAWWRERFSAQRMIEQTLDTYQR